MLENTSGGARVLLINPPSLFDPKDPFTTGIVYMPIGLAYLASSLKTADVNFKVIDVFGQEPQIATTFGRFVRLGLSNQKVSQEIEEFSPTLILLYANQVLNHDALIDLIKVIRNSFSSILIGILENSQAVTAYKVNSVADTFFSVGVNFLVSGDLENRVLNLLDYLLCNDNQLQSGTIDGISLPGNISEPVIKKNEIENLSIPLWDDFPLESYWSLKYAHGPKSQTKYLPILTSRGCPFSCAFCVVPSVSQRKWVSRSPESIFFEMSEYYTKYGVSEFHLEDLNPTIDENRMIALANLIINSGLKFTWKIVAGTKIETIKNLKTFSLLSKSGLRFISMSPESGSRKVQKLIGKFFDKEYGVEVAKVCRKNNIATQACFILGFPGERLIDIFYSFLYMCKLTWFGLDEIAIFIVAPIPGSKLSTTFNRPNTTLSELNFSPKWRKDFRRLNASRFLMYSVFVILKFSRHPFEIMRFLKNISARSFRTKMEMTIFRGYGLYKLSRRING